MKNLRAKTIRTHESVGEIHLIVVEHGDPSLESYARAELACNMTMIDGEVVIDRPYGSIELFDETLRLVAWVFFSSGIVVSTDTNIASILPGDILAALSRLGRYN